MKQHAPSAERNRGPIAAALAPHLPARGTVLEIASGSGQHAVFLAEAFPGLTWQPTAPGEPERASIAAYQAEAARPNLLAPLDLDVRVRPWPVPRADALLCINLIHISPWACTEALFAGAAAVLPAGAPIVLYGPFREADQAFVASNVAFDAWLRGLDPAYGVRALEAVDGVAAAAGFIRRARIAMPANNLCVVWERGATGG